MSTFRVISTETVTEKHSAKTQKKRTQLDFEALFQV